MILDFLKDIGSLWNRKGKKEDYVTEEAEEDGSTPKKKKEAETDVLSMKEGDYGTIYGIKKQYVKYMIYGTACLIGIAFFYNIGNKMGDDSKNAAIRQESVADVQNSKKEMSSEALNSINSAVKNGQPLPGQNTQNPQNPNEVQVRRNQTNNTNIPQIPQANNQYRQQQQMPYGNYYQLPSMMNQPAVATAEQKEEDSLSKKLEDSLKSAIAFFNGADGMSGSNSQSSTASSGGAEGVPTGPQSSYAYTAPSPYVLQAGTCIPAMLISSINSDIAGIVAAQVISDVYDTATGYNLLIPAGSRLVGSYEAKENGGRVSVNFTELILPSGASYSISDGLIAIDKYGYMGLTGSVNHHTNSKLTSAAIGAGIAAGTAAAFGNTNTNSNTYTTGQIAQQGAMASVMTNVSNMFNKALDQADTVKVQAGTQFNIFVSKGLVFNE